MRLLLTAAAASLAIATAACNQKSDGEGTDTSADATLNGGDANLAMNDMNGMNDMNMADHNMAAMATTAEGFVTTIAGSDMFEIESGKLAQSQGTSDAVKKFGAMLVKDHTKSSSELKAAASSSKPAVTVPTALPAEHQAKLDALKAAKGAEFDRLFGEQQTAAHQMALDTLRGYASGGDNDQLKAFASKTATVVEAHLNQAKTLGK